PGPRRRGRDAPMTIELLETMESISKRYSVAPDQAADLGQEPAVDQVTITWQQVSGRAASVLVTVPAGPEGWAIPVPHRPDWLTGLIVKDAPSWWLK
ncbi:hypothetical protein PV708_36310, partial [Streptomyces sp. ME02-6977A]